MPSMALMGLQRMAVPHNGGPPALPIQMRALQHRLMLQLPLAGGAWPPHPMAALPPAHGTYLPQSMWPGQPGAGMGRAALGVAPGYPQGNRLIPPNMLMGASPHVLHAPLGPSPASVPQQQPQYVRYEFQQQQQQQQQRPHQPPQHSQQQQQQQLEHMQRLRMLQYPVTPTPHPRAVPPTELKQVVASSLDHNPPPLNVVPSTLSVEAVSRRTSYSRSSPPMDRRGKCPSKARPRHTTSHGLKRSRQATTSAQRHPGAAYTSQQRFRGVTLCASGRYRCKLHHNGGSISVGRFDTDEAAAVAYDMAALLTRGKAVNFSLEEMRRRCRGLGDTLDMVWSRLDAAGAIRSPQSAKMYALLSEEGDGTQDYGDGDDDGHGDDDGDDAKLDDVGGSAAHGVGRSARDRHRRRAVIDDDDDASHDADVEEASIPTAIVSRAPGSSASSLSSSSSSSSSPARSGSRPTSRSRSRSRSQNPRQSKTGRVQKSRAAVKRRRTPRLAAASPSSPNSSSASAVDTDSSVVEDFLGFVAAAGGSRGGRPQEKRQAARSVSRRTKKRRRS